MIMRPIYTPKGAAKEYGDYAMSYIPKSAKIRPLQSFVKIAVPI